VEGPPGKTELPGLLEERVFHPFGKFEIESRRMADAGYSALPAYRPVPGHEKLKDPELILTTFQWNVHTHFSTANCKWLSEIIHANPAWIHPGPPPSEGSERETGFK